MNLKEALNQLEPLAVTPAQQDALDTLWALACERDDALRQAETEYNRNESLNRQLDAALAMVEAYRGVKVALKALIEATQHLKPCPGTLDDARKALTKARGEL